MKKELLLMLGLVIGIVLGVMIHITVEDIKYCKQIDELTVLVSEFNDDYSQINVYAEMEFHDDEAVTIHIFRNGSEFVSVSPHVFYETWVKRKILEEA